MPTHEQMDQTEMVAGLQYMVRGRVTVQFRWGKEFLDSGTFEVNCTEIVRNFEVNLLQVFRSEVLSWKNWKYPDPEF
jgi:hypothetical protein